MHVSIAFCFRQRVTAGDSKCVAIAARHWFVKISRRPTGFWCAIRQHEHSVPHGGQEEVVAAASVLLSCCVALQLRFTQNLVPSMCCWGDALNKCTPCWPEAQLCGQHCCRVSVGAYALRLFVGGACDLHRRPWVVCPCPLLLCSQFVQEGASKR